MKTDPFSKVVSRKMRDDGKPTRLDQVWANPRNGDAVRVLQVQGLPPRAYVTFQLASGDTRLTTMSLSAFMSEYQLDEKYVSRGVMGCNEWYRALCPARDFSREGVAL